MPIKKNNDLRQNLKHGDIQKIVTLSDTSYPTVLEWLKSDEYRNYCEAKIDTLITNAYHKVITSNAKQRQDNINKLQSLNHE
jgi:hypothetical protein